MPNRTRWALVAVLLPSLAPRGAWADAAPGGASPLADDRTLVALAVSLSCADAPDGVEGAPSPEPAPPAAEGPELELVATVRAKALRFETVPKVNVVFTGNGKRRTVWKTERVNLPMHPEPGVTYRDVQVRLTVTSSVDELGSLLAQAHRASRGIVLEDDAASPASPASAAAPSAPAAAPAPGAPAAPSRAAVPAPPSSATPAAGALVPAPLAPAPPGGTR